MPQLTFPQDNVGLLHNAVLTDLLQSGLTLSRLTNTELYQTAVAFSKKYYNAPASVSQEAIDLTLNWARTPATFDRLRSLLLDYKENNYINQVQYDLELTLVNQLETFGNQENPTVNDVDDYLAQWNISVGNAELSQSQKDQLYGSSAVASHSFYFWSNAMENPENPGGNISFAWNWQKALAIIGGDVVAGLLLSPAAGTACSTLVAAL